MSILTTRRQLATAAAAAVLGAGPDAPVPARLRDLAVELAEAHRQHARLFEADMARTDPTAPSAALPFEFHVLHGLQRRLRAELARTTLPGLVLAGHPYLNAKAPGLARF